MVAAKWAAARPGRSSLVFRPHVSWCGNWRKPSDGKGAETAPVERSAGGGDRTHTILRSLDFESSASANSATPASAKFDTTKRGTKLKFQSLFPEEKQSVCAVPVA